MTDSLPLVMAGVDVGLGTAALVAEEAPLH
jgi:hypothetical protein